MRRGYQLASASQLGFFKKDLLVSIGYVLYPIGLIPSISKHLPCWAGHAVACPSEYGWGGWLMWSGRPFRSFTIFPIFDRILPILVHDGSVNIFYMDWLHAPEPGLPAALGCHVGQGSAAQWPAAAERGLLQFVEDMPDRRGEAVRASLKTSDYRVLSARQSPMGNDRLILRAVNGVFESFGGALDFCPGSARRLRLFCDFFLERIHLRAVPAMNHRAAIHIIRVFVCKFHLYT
jgi:hypothetical protein